MADQEDTSVEKSEMIVKTNLFYRVLVRFSSANMNGHGVP